MHNALSDTANERGNTIKRDSWLNKEALALGQPLCPEDGLDQQGSLYSVGKVYSLHAWAKGGQSDVVELLHNGAEGTIRTVRVRRVHAKPDGRLCMEHC